MTYLGRKVRDRIAKLEKLVIAGELNSSSSRRRTKGLEMQAVDSFASSRTIPTIPAFELDSLPSNTGSPINEMGSQTPSTPQDSEIWCFSPTPTLCGSCRGLGYQSSQTLSPIDSLFMLDDPENAAQSTIPNKIDWWPAADASTHHLPGMTPNNVLIV